MTKLEVFAAYLSHGVGVVDGAILGNMCSIELDDLTGGRAKIYCSGDNSLRTRDVNSLRLLLHPLSRLTETIKHPATGEEIVPVEWIAAQALGVPGETIHGKENVRLFLIGSNGGTAKFNIQTVSNIIQLALSLHFDIYGAIEKGWAKEIVV